MRGGYVFARAKYGYQFRVDLDCGKLRAFVDERARQCAGAGTDLERAKLGRSAVQGQPGDAACSRSVDEKVLTEALFGA
ncbi:MAG: hypothetical protein ABSF08_09220 [Candidatus Cybelea sp.]